ncbi:MAG: YbhN family protein [Bacilli bacterium]
MKRKKIINILMLFIVTSLVLFLSLKDNFHEVMKQITTMNPFWILACLFLILSYFFFRAITTMILAKKFNKNFSIIKALKLEFEMAFFNGVTPFATGGQPYVIYSLKKSNLKMVEATNVTIQNFIIYQIALVLLGLYAIISNYIFKQIPNNNILNELAFIGFFINSLVIIFLFVISFAKKTNRYLLKKIIKLLVKIKIIKNEKEFNDKFENNLNEFHIGAELLLKNKWKFITLIICQIVSLISIYLIPLSILYGMGDYTSYNSVICIILTAYVVLIGSFIPMPGGTGGIEYAFVVFFGYFITGAKLSSVMLIWRFITYYFGIIIGAILLNFRKEEKL